MRPTAQVGLRIAALTATVCALIGFFSGPGANRAPAQERPVAAPSAEQAQPTARARPPGPREFPGLDPRVHRIVDGVAVADLNDGSTALLSLEPGLQAHMSALYERYEVPYAGLVAIDPRDGRVLAYVSHSSAEPGGADRVLDPSPPTASVFKVITAAALIDQGVNPGDEVCYHGGSSRLRLSNLADDPGRDQRCATLATAMGHSINSVFAKLADRHLQPTVLQRYASAFGFGHALPFDVATRVSALEIPHERLEFARTAAGFWHMHMSPLHGALIASTIAADGRMPRATLVDEVIDPTGGSSYQAHAEVFREVIPRATARAVSTMMRDTVTSGTARRHFFDQRGNAFLPGIDVAGKTGTLTNAEPYRGYNWFIGFAPVEEPTIAVAALVVNEPRWRIKAAFAAREALRYHLIEAPRLAARRAREAAAASRTQESMIEAEAEAAESSDTETP